MSQRTFIQALVAQQSPAAAVTAHETRGPILPIHSISYQVLSVDQKIKDLMKAIMQSGSPYDKGKKTSTADDTPGAMRQIHYNSLPHRYLVNLEPVDPSNGKPKLYNQYAIAYKKGQGNGIPSGYIEYTASDLTTYDWGGNRMRIVFDYINSKLYFAPFHYASWTIPPTGDYVNIVDKPAWNSGSPSPFFWITDL